MLNELVQILRDLLISQERRHDFLWWKIYMKKAIVKKLWSKEVRKTLISFHNQNQHEWFVFFNWYLIFEEFSIEFFWQKFQDKQDFWIFDKYLFEIAFGIETFHMSWTRKLRMKSRDKYDINNK